MRTDCMRVAAKMLDSMESSKKLAFMQCVLQYFYPALTVHVFSSIYALHNFPHVGYQPCRKTADSLWRDSHPMVSFVCEFAPTFFAVIRCTQAALRHSMCQ
jgi:hypothetical protein